jgi:hypothetical protein
MSQIPVPITDAFDSTDQLELIEVELTSKQIEWLDRKAEERSVSRDHMLRSLVTAQIRGTTEGRPRPSSGDGAPLSSTASKKTSDDDPESTTIVESLRSASKQLQDLTEDKETTEESELPDTLSRLRTRLNHSSESDESRSDSSSETVLLDDAPQSMFDLMEDE